VIFERPRRPPTPGAFARAAAQGRLRLQLDTRSRCLYAGRRFAINGEVCPPSAFDPRLALLADTRRLGSDSLRGAPASLLTLLHDWHAAGWMHRELR
jgi:hypothetical protein